MKEKGTYQENICQAERTVPYTSVFCRKNRQNTYMLGRTCVILTVSNEAAKPCADAHAGFSKYISSFLKERYFCGIRTFLFVLNSVYDLLAAEASIRFRIAYPSCYVLCYIPNENTFLQWAPSFRHLYQDVLDSCDDVEFFPDSSQNVSTTAEYVSLSTAEEVLLIMNKGKKQWPELIQAVIFTYCLENGFPCCKHIWVAFYEEIAQEMLVERHTIHRRRIQGGKD